LNESQEWLKEDETAAGQEPFYKRLTFNVRDSIKSWTKAAEDRLMAAKVRPAPRTRQGTAAAKETPELPKGSKVGEGEFEKARLKMVASVLRRIQAVVRDHDALIDLFRELFNRQEKQIVDVNVKQTKVEEKVQDNINLVVKMKEDQTKANEDAKD
jgi:hypothetical protein